MCFGSDLFGMIADAASQRSTNLFSRIQNYVTWIEMFQDILNSVIVQRAADLLLSCPWRQPKP